MTKEEIEICIDVHTRLDPPDTIRLGRKLEQYERPRFAELLGRSSLSHEIVELE